MNDLKALDGPKYWFGGLNQSNLKISKWLIVGPRPGLVQTMDYWFGLLVYSLQGLLRRYDSADEF